MLPDRVSNPGPLTYESGALSTALRGQIFTKRQATFEQRREKISLKLAHTLIVVFHSFVCIFKFKKLHALPISEWKIPIGLYI